MVQFDINRVVPQGEARGTIPTVLAADMDTDALEALLLAVEGQMVGELIGEDDRQCRGGSDAARKKSRLPDR